MADSLAARAARSGRVLTRMLSAAAMLAAFFLVVNVVGARIGGLAGVAAGAVAGGCLVFGVRLAYLNLVDWLDLRVIRRSPRAGGEDLRDGEVYAFDGRVRTEGAPMRSPFGGVPCAAYTYAVTGSRNSSVRSRSVRVDVAHGFHMLRTRIESAHGSLRVRSFPAFEDELRRTESGTTWGDEARALLEEIAGRASRAGEWVRRAQRLEAQRTGIDEIHRDYLNGRIGKHADGLTIVEEVLPAGEVACVIGTYEKEAGALSARRFRLGQRLVVYRGSADEVAARVGKDVGFYARAAAVSLAIGLLIVGFALHSAPGEPDRARAASVSGR